MNRRQILKAITITGAGAVVLPGCKPDAKAPEVKKPDAVADLKIDRAAEEKIREKALFDQKFFDDHEMATMAVLSDIIIPRDEVSGSATDAGVPAFIEFMVKDKPELQTPMRGGLRWLDMQSVKQFGKAFKDATDADKIKLVDAIAYPKKVAAGMQPGVNFFSLMRNLTASGFYSSKIGIEDIGYKGNTPNQWNGVPDDVLKQYGLAYTQKELDECVKFS